MIPGAPGRVLRSTPVLLTAVLAACGAPDQSRSLPTPMPDAVGEFLVPDSIRQYRVSRGVHARALWSSRGPWAVFLLDVDLQRCDLGVRVLPAGDPPAGALGRARVSELTAGRTDVLAAVNADFYTPEGRPVGWEVLDGAVLHRGSRPAFAWRVGEHPWMGRPSREGGDVIFGWPASASVPDGQTMAVGGFPLLLVDGERVGDLGVSSRPSFAEARHPRTAVGYDPDRRRLWILVVDGRQEGYSDGMSLPEVATLFEALEVRDAINLDGGGSSIMVLPGRTLSHPSDAEGERAVANALAVTLDPARCDYRPQRAVTPR